MQPNNSDATRRRILLGIGSAVTAGIAGCSGDGGDGGASNDTPTDTESMESMETETESAMTETESETDTETDTPSGTAMVRIAHMSPNAPNVDVYVDGTAVLEDVAFGAVSPYLDLPAGEHQVEITAAGDPDASVFAGPVTVAAETAYTIAAVGEVGDGADQAFEPLIMEDDNSDPGSDTARVRLVHASPDAPAVDVTLAANGDGLYDGVEYAGYGYVEVPAGDYTLQVRGDTDSNDGSVVAEFDVSLAAGQVYTAFASGYLSPDDEPGDTPFDLRIAQDTSDGSMTEEMETETDPASVRVAHMSPNAPNVDVYVDGAAVLEDVAFGAVSPYLDLPAGEHQVEITAAGDPDASVFSGPVTVEAGTPYTIAAVGEVGDGADQAFEPLIMEDDNSDPGSDTARIRLVHTSPDAPAVDVTLAANGDALYDGVGYMGYGYMEVPAGDYTLQVRGDTDSNDGSVVAEFDVSLAAGQVYTAFASGYLSPDDEPSDTPFDLRIAQDTN